MFYLAVMLNVTKLDGFSQSDQRIPCRDEFLTHKTFVFDFDKLLHDRWKEDFLLVVEFGSTWISRGVNVANDVFHRADSTNDVAVHDLNMVDVEQ